MSDSTAPKTGLLDLPPEIHDQIWSYLDWDFTQDLLPTRGDVINVGNVCRHLRQTAVPTLFRHVTLRLRWYVGILSYRNVG